MKIALMSDNHLGVTKPKNYKRVLQNLRDSEEFDLFVHCGDYCGAQVGHKTLGLSVRIFRDIFPDKPYLSVIGNHDFWVKGRKSGQRPSEDDHRDNLSIIQDTFKLHNVHFLDTDGLFYFKNWVFMGHSGWYTNPNPPTNDNYFLPNALEGDTNRHLLKQAHTVIGDQLDALGTRNDKIIFVSHFPVINVGNDWKGGFEEFSWSASLGELIHDDYNCRHFLNGHAHQSHNGPIRYESGSDYGYPRYLIIDVPEHTTVDLDDIDATTQNGHEIREQ